MNFDRYKFEPVPVPKAHPENSPTFQRWVKDTAAISPEGTVASRWYQHAARSVRRRSAAFRLQRRRIRQRHRLNPMPCWFPHLCSLKAALLRGATVEMRPEGMPESLLHCRRAANHVGFSRPFGTYHYFAVAPSVETLGY